ncbi:MAG: S53 family peptidase [Minisyncoccia bacterium]
MSNLVKALVALGAAILLVGSFSFAYAQGLDIGQLQSRSSISGAINAFVDQLKAKGDPVPAEDRDAYINGNSLARSGAAFQPYIKVCTDAGVGQASCNARVITDSAGVPVTNARNPSQSSALPAGYGPAQFHGAYNLPLTAAAGTPIIAIVDAYDDPNIASDLNTYSTMYGLPQCTTANGCFKKVNQTGGTKYPNSNAGWALEISLDVEIAHATCQNCNIMLVEANSATYTNLMAAEDYAIAHASVVSNSWGSGEFGGASGETSYDYHFTNPNHPGVAITFSAGDGGYGAEYPASSPYVTAVGGTSLSVNSLGNNTYSYKSESAWSGTGSGCSSYEPQPSWQTALGLSGCSKRIVADVSADADPNTGAAVYDSVRYAGMSGWFQVGGTSLASPIIAATYALSGNIPANTSENSIPYKNVGDLRDVTSGSNGSCGGSYLCTAMPGFDGPTGEGTPNGTAAF